MVEWAKFKPEVSGSLLVSPLVGLCLFLLILLNLGVSGLSYAGHSQHHLPLLADQRKILRAKREP